VGLIEPPYRELRIDDRGPIDPETLGRRRDGVVALGEWEARGVDPDRRQAVTRIALIPGAEVGEGPDRVELGEVEEVDDQGLRRYQAVDRLDRLADPIETGGQRGDGDIWTRGPQTRRVCSRGLSEGARGDSREQPD
jgi:hypothetical protein